MTSSTVFDRRSGSIALGCATFASGVYGIVSGFSHSDTSLALLLIGSLFPFMLGLMCTIVAVTSTDEHLAKLNTNWTGMSNLFSGLLAGFWLFYFGLSAVFAGAPQVGGIFAGLALALTAWTMVRFP
jgi:hypothetical protein